ncbi:hypothetical protein Psi02_49870 [Planotetraspora silvatica]|uniref:Uncharacterized protein n=1 Tax=Planotetraspora silvatica TaxID=234614 RepID=A0A8J3UNQ4_9ACTN|nr:hypothetical protein [Planotetraspora silvatica]GII48563.1 hypothetical protein Psi02_49870 [Planotetraspora silvatica]
MISLSDRSVRLAAVVLAGCCWLTACGGSDSKVAAQNDGVASLVTESPAGTSGTAKADPAGDSSSGSSSESKRPQLRLDSSAEEVAAYRKAYAECLTDHGSPTKTSGEPTKAEVKAYEAARKACVNKEPLMPPEFSPKTNPHYADDVRKEVACLKRHGFKVHITPATGSDPNAIGWTYDSIPGEGVDITKIQNVCRAEGYGGGAALEPGAA